MPQGCLACARVALRLELCGSSWGLAAHCTALPCGSGTRDDVWGARLCVETRRCLSCLASLAAVDGDGVDEWGRGLRGAKSVGSVDGG